MNNMRIAVSTVKLVVISLYMQMLSNDEVPSLDGNNQKSINELIASVFFFLSVTSSYVDELSIRPFIKTRYTFLRQKSRLASRSNALRRYVFALIFQRAKCRSSPTTCWLLVLWMSRKKIGNWIFFYLISNMMFCGEATPACFASTWLTESELYESVWGD